MTTLKSAAFKLLLAIIVSTVGWYCFFLETPPRPEYTYRIVEKYQRCRDGYHGNACWEIVRSEKEITKP